MSSVSERRVEGGGERRAVASGGAPPREHPAGAQPFDQFPSAVDVTLLDKLQQDAGRLADEVDAVLVGLRRDVHTACSHTARGAEVYATAVDSIGSEVDTCLRSMASLIAKCEELDRGMGPVEHIRTEM